MISAAESVHRRWCPRHGTPESPQRSSPRAGGLAARRLVPAVALAMAVGLGACSSGGGSTPAARSSPSPAQDAAAITITPSDGTQRVTVTDHVVVTANAPLADVAAARGASASQKTPAGQLTGEFSADRRTWTSNTGLFADSQYRVEASTTATAGITGTATTTATFATGTPKSQFKVSWEPVDGQTVGVGTPVTLTFSGPVSDRAAVQRRLVIATQPVLEGSWSWASNRVIRWRPRAYWPSGTKAHVEANLAGFDDGAGRLGVKDRTMDFTIGAAQISQVDVAAHTMKVYRNGQLVRTMAISGGKSGFPTMEGPHNVIGKAPKVIMDSATVGIPKGSPEYYYEEVEWNVQYTSGGQYVHSAPWSVGSQGRTNVSHGCVNASPTDAEWFFNFSQFGDIVDIHNTGRPADTTQLGNDWSIPWATWVAGSALPASADPASVAAPATAGTGTHPGA